LDVLELDEDAEVEALGAAAVVVDCWTTAAAVVDWRATVVVGSAGTMTF
jgi:hypothetical protein